jgi:hypothetical protein
MHDDDIQRKNESVGRHKSKNILDKSKSVFVGDTRQRDRDKMQRHAVLNSYGKQWHRRTSRYTTYALRIYANRIGTSEGHGTRGMPAKVKRDDKEDIVTDKFRVADEERCNRRQKKAMDASRAHESTQCDACDELADKTVDLQITLKERGDSVEGPVGFQSAGALDEDVPNDSGACSRSRDDLRASSSISSSSEAQRLVFQSELEIDHSKSPGDNADHLWRIKSPANISLISYFLGKK